MFHRGASGKPPPTSRNGPDIRFIPRDDCKSGLISGCQPLWATDRALTGQRRSGFRIESRRHHRSVPECRRTRVRSDHTVDNLPYGASKGALDRIVLAAARELAHLNITSNVVNPGPIDTGWMDQEIRAYLLKRQPTGRLGTPQDIANLVGFLLSPAGSWINGQLIKSDGGFST